MNPRLYLKLLKKPEPKPVAPKPVYARVPLYGMIVTNRIDAWQARRDALEAEQTRTLAQDLSRRQNHPPARPVKE